MRGFRDAKVYPLGGPDVATARRLAGHRRRHAVFYTCEVPSCLDTAAIIRSNLRRIGIDVEIRQISFDTLSRRESRAGEPWDLTIWGWLADYGDPADVIDPLFGAPGHPRVLSENFNLGRFTDPGFARKLAAADRRTGARRYRAYARLDADLARHAAPVAAYGTDTNDYFFSARMGCQVISPIYGVDLPALCVRR